MHFTTCADENFKEDDVQIHFEVYIFNFCNLIEKDMERLKYYYVEVFNET